VIDGDSAPALFLGRNLVDVAVEIPQRGVPGGQLERPDFLPIELRAFTAAEVGEAWSMALAGGVVTRGSGRGWWSSQRKVLVDHGAHAVRKAGAV
jgi:hypothetical protein